MSNWQKIAVGVVAALLLGLIAGYLLGASGKGELEAAAERSRKVLNALKITAAESKTDFEATQNKDKRRIALLRAKEQLLRCSVQLHANNFGIASQRLGAASTALKSAHKLSSSGVRKRIDAIVAEIGQAHSLSMRLDPTVRVHLERIVELVHGLPDAQ